MVVVVVVVVIVVVAGGGASSGGVPQQTQVQHVSLSSTCVIGHEIGQLRCQSQSRKSYFGHFTLMALDCLFMYLHGIATERKRIKERKVSNVLE